jgi:hypothetical protein
MYYFWLPRTHNSGKTEVLKENFPSETLSTQIPYETESEMSRWDTGD